MNSKFIQVFQAVAVSAWQRTSHRLLSTSLSDVAAATKDFSKERKMTALELQHLKRKGTKHLHSLGTINISKYVITAGKRIAMLTAYDYPTVGQLPSRSPRHFLYI
jgi:hypothetical protein